MSEGFLLDKDPFERFPSVYLPFFTISCLILTSQEWSASVKHETMNGVLLFSVYFYLRGPGLSYGIELQESESSFILYDSRTCYSTTLRPHSKKI